MQRKKTEFCLKKKMKLLTTELATQFKESALLDKRDLVEFGGNWA
ncbi:hypothetical protein ACFQ2O_20545 [Pontibacter rugosus]|uniref:Uncharacterized protein n=1 Tax=Pontibacter rugosus TaxID=1745966 RepID=A0ABW3SUM2_9BACT